MQASIEAAENVQVICQIESIHAVGNARAIAATPGVDGIFVGRADLAWSMGLADSQHPDVLKATELAIAAGVSQAKRVGVVAGSVEERERYRSLGATWFLHGSDQSLLKQAARALVRA